MKAKWSHSIFSPGINTFLNKYSKIYKQNKNDIIIQKLYEMGYTNLWQVVDLQLELLMESMM